ncbi:MAG: NAD(+) synthase [Rikenellaceae bacterium]
MKITVAQINTKIGDVVYNSDIIKKEINTALEKGSDLIIFPEFAISGTPLYTMVSEPDFIDKCYAALEDIALGAIDIDVLIGMPTQSGDDYFSSVVHIKKGIVKSIFSKAMIDAEYEKPYFKGIDSLDYNDESEEIESEIPMNIITVAQKRLLVVIGEDLDYIEGVEKSLKVDAIVSIASPIYAMGMIEDEYDVLIEAAKAFKTPIIRCSMVGANSVSYLNFGASCVINILGEVAYGTKEFCSDVINFELESTTTHKSANNYLAPRKKAKDNFNAIKMALGDFFTKQSLTKAVVGLSGGIDSAVVLALAVETLGAENVTAILMPSDFSSKGSVDDSVKMAEGLKIEYHKLPISATFNTMVESMKPVFKDLPFSIAEENIQARIRGMMLMAYSNKFGNIVLNTSNKSECAVGYGTIYGDTNGAISLIGDLYKDEVYELAYYINTKMGDAIPREILEKEPSAELHPDQKDSDSLPQYEELDSILRLLLESKSSILECVSHGFDVDTVTSVVKLIAGAEHKRYQLPPVIKLSSHTFGMELKMPLGAKRI